MCSPTQKIMVYYMMVYYSTRQKARYITCGERAIPQVQLALASKVSRERFGSEIKGCIGGAVLCCHRRNLHQLACCENWIKASQHRHWAQSRTRACSNRWPPSWSASLMNSIPGIMCLATVNSLLVQKQAVWSYACPSTKQSHVAWCWGLGAGPDPVLAMRLLAQLGLFPVVFQLPGGAAAPPPPVDAGARCVACMAAAADLLHVWQPQVRPRPPLALAIPVSSYFLPPSSAQSLSRSCPWPPYQPPPAPDLV